MKSRLMKKPSKETQRAIDDEVKKQLARIVEHIACDMDVQTLYTLASQYGWRKHRLRKFYEAFDKAQQELKEYYLTTPFVDGYMEQNYYAREELKRIGVDVENWRKEKSNWEPENDEVWQEHGEKGYRNGKKRTI